MDEIYLDNNATTHVSPAVLAEVTRTLGIYYANPSSVHHAGETVDRLIGNARQRIADFLGCLPEEIVFTASGSEANNLALWGFARANKRRGRHIISSPIEHPSVLKTLGFLAQEGFEISTLPVDKEGFIDPEELANSIRPDTILVSIMAANNEIGTIQEINNLSAICKNMGVSFHSDMVQALGKVNIDLKDSKVSLASFSGHKIHAPKGIGILYKEKSISLSSLVHGGNQEFGLRAGTENLPYIMGMAKAIEELSQNDCSHMAYMQRYLLDNLSQIPGIRLNGPADVEQRICSNVNISIEHQEGEFILKQLSSKGIFVSTGSACSSKSTKISPVLRAISCPVNYIHGNIRVSLSKYNTISHIDKFLAELKSILGIEPVYNFDMEINKCA